MPGPRVTERLILYREVNTLRSTPGLKRLTGLAISLYEGSREPSGHRRVGARAPRAHYSRTRSRDAKFYTFVTQRDRSEIKQSKLGADRLVRLIRRTNYDFSFQHDGKSQGENFGGASLA